MGYCLLFRNFNFPPDLRALFNIILNVVLLPAPFGPTNPKKFYLDKPKEMFLNAIFFVP